MAINSLRFGGMHSGLDTESIVKAMSAATMLKINNNKRKVLKLEAQQVAYRDVISKLQGFQKKYLDVLNRNTYLKSANTFRQFKSTIYDSAGKVATPPGVTVSSGSNAIPGTYKVELKSKGTQAALKGEEFGADVKMDLNKIQTSSSNSFAFSLKVGSTSKNFVFEKGADNDATVANINQALKDTFGTTNSGVGLVQMDAFGKITSANKQEITVTGAIGMSDEQKLAYDLSQLKSGSNSINIQIGDELKKFDFSTLVEDHFDFLFSYTAKDGTVINNTGDAEQYMDAIAAKRYAENLAEAWNDSMANDYSVWNTNNDYSTWLAENGGNQDALDALMKTAYDIALKANPNDPALADKDAWIASTPPGTAFAIVREKLDDDLKTQAYNIYKAGVPTGGTVTSKEDWLVGKTTEDAYNVVRDKTVADLQTSAYNLYKASLAKGDVADDKDTWIAANVNNPQAAFNYVYENTRFTSEAWVRESVQAEYDQKMTVFEKVATELYNQIAFPEYEAWKDSPAYDAEKDLIYTAKFEAERQKLIDAYWDKTYDAAKTKAYNEYKKDTSDDPILSMEDWEAVVGNFDSKADFIANKEDDYWQAYYDHTRTAEYNEWKKTAGNTDDIDTWASTHFTQTLAQFRADATRQDGYYQDAKIAMLDREVYRKGAYNEYSAYKEYSDLTSAPISAGLYEDFKKTVNSAQAITEFNQGNLKNALEGYDFKDDVKLEVNFVNNEAVITAVDKDGNPVDFALTMNSSVNGDLWKADYETFKPINTTITLGTRLDEIDGLNFTNGRTSFEINGKTISLAGNLTVSEAMSAINNSDAGVMMTLSTLTNSFTLTSKAYGTSAKVEIGDQSAGSFAAALGLTGTAEAGKNMELEVNGQLIETPSNSYTVDGTTITFANDAKIGDAFTIEVGKDNSQVISAIKEFVEDYNKLILDVFGYTSEKPNKDYKFLTDNEIEEMGLSDRQAEQWETAAKKGLLYGDNTISDIMFRLRTAMYTSVTGSNGQSFGVYNIRGNDGTVAIKATSDYKMNGMLEFDEQALIEAFERNPDDIIKLFTDPGGLMSKVEDVLNYAVKSTGALETQGVLIQRAGLATGLSSLDNTIFDRIKTLNDMIDKLQVRYERQQNRYWKVFTAMEKQFASMNSQSDYVSNMFGSMKS